jgi:hypothetical protein
MKLTINIPVTRKRTRQGYYVLHPGGKRDFHLLKSNAVSQMEYIAGEEQKRLSKYAVVTARDYAKKKGSA